MTGEDGVTITFELRLKPEAVDFFKGAAGGMLEGARNFAGFRTIRIVQHQDDPTRMLFVEQWDSEHAYQSYIAWRVSRGEMDGLAAFAVGTETNVWPHLVTEAGDQSGGGDPGVTITFELKLKPEFAQAFLGASNMDVASTFAGFRGIRLVQHKEDPTRVLFVERWDSAAAYQAYVDYRTGRGEMEGLKQILERAETDVWPNLVVEA